MLTEGTGMDSSPRFDRAPRSVYWEVTRACDLACRHCRAVAAPDPYSAELTERDGLVIIDQLAGFGAGIRDDNGIMFISHTGWGYPSGFLPLPVGCVTTADPVDLYGDSGVFRAMRRPDLLRSRCGRCEWRERCRGSRARAFAATGDPLGEDPLCSYEPVWSTQ